MSSSVDTCVYKITNTINGFLYIGIAGLPDTRWREHKREARLGSPLPLYQAMREYGVEHFTFEVLGWHRQPWNARQKESRLITSLKTYTPYGYNSAIGQFSRPVMERLKAARQAGKQEEIPCP